MKKTITLVALSIILFGCGTETITYEEIQEKKDSKTQAQKKIELPEKLILDVPFISQAPHSNWDDPYQEACEEASMIMVYNYLQGINSISKEEVDKQILDLVAYQNSIGLTYDINTSEMKEVIKEFYNLESTIITEKSINIESFKNTLNNGYPIIIPAQGQQLNNPNFTNGGPEYHMLVVKGYDDKKQEFITNDPGTRNGENYTYSYDTIMDAIHDWTGNKATVQFGEKRALIFDSK